MSAAIRLANVGRVLVVTKEELAESNTAYAQGGIAVAMGGDEDVALHPVLSDLRLSRFVQPDPATYQTLRTEFEATLQYWRRHALALEVHPAFRELTPPPEA